MFSAWAICRMVVVLPEMISPYPLLPEKWNDGGSASGIFPALFVRGACKRSGRRLLLAASAWIG